MGFSNLVYPGANHTRFHHALGCIHLMQKAIRVLRFKQVEISKEEENGLLIAILLHDIGHGAFSHALEHSIVDNISHEEISLKFMKKLNNEFDNKLSLAIEIFEGKYHRKFLWLSFPPFWWACGSSRPRVSISGRSGPLAAWALLFPSWRWRPTGKSACSPRLTSKPKSKK